MPLEVDPGAKLPIGRAEIFGEFEDMPTIYRVTSGDGASVGDADSIDDVVAVVSDAAPGHYLIQIVSLDTATGDLRSWEWGGISKSVDGQITLDPPPWFD